MTNQTNDGGPAFPTQDAEVLGGVAIGQKGMSLRDWFAGESIPKALSMAEDYFDPTSKDGMFYPCAAQICYNLADAMLKAREAKQ